MKLKNIAAAGALALATAGALAAAGPALAGGPQPHPAFGGPDVISPTSVDGNGILNNLLSLNVCGTNLIPIELVPVVSPTTAGCEDSQNEGVIEVEENKFHKFNH